MKWSHAKTQRRKDDGKAARDELAVSLAFVAARRPHNSSGASAGLRALAVLGEGSLPGEITGRQRDGAYACDSYLKVLPEDTALAT